MEDNFKPRFLRAFLAATLYLKMVNESRTDHIPPAFDVNRREDMEALWVRTTTELLSFGRLLNAKLAPPRASRAEQKIAACWLGPLTPATLQLLGMTKAPTPDELEADERVEGRLAEVVAAMKEPEVFGRLTASSRIIRRGSAGWRTCSRSLPAPTLSSPAAQGW